MHTNRTSNRAVVPSNLFIINDGAGVSGVAGGSGSATFCNLPDTAASRYIQDMPSPKQYFTKIDMNIDGAPNPAYCMQKGVAGPSGQNYSSASLESLMPGATALQKRMLGWLVSNTYPVISAAQLFQMAGVDASQNPPLDDNDAYATISAAVWGTLLQVSADDLVFLECDGGALHPKSDRLNAAVLSLMAQAEGFAQTAVNDAPLPAMQNQSCCNSSSAVYCCNNSTIPQDPSQPYIAFSGCANEARMVCGRVLVGPFTLQSNFTELPEFSFEPMCACEDGFTVSFADFCGNPIERPALNQEFYLIVRTVRDHMCFNVTATVGGSVIQVLFMGETNPGSVAHQHVVYARMGVRFDTSATICVCIDLSKVEGTAICDPGSTTVINNNNNNNNNSNSSNGGGGFGFMMPPWWNMPWGGAGQWPYPPMPPMPINRPCPIGTHYVPGMGCMADGAVCPPGTHFVPGFGCVPDGERCPPDTHFVPGLGCRPDDAVCPPGTRFVPGFGCVPIDDDPRPPRPPAPPCNCGGCGCRPCPPRPCSCWGGAQVPPFCPPICGGRQMKC